MKLTLMNVSLCLVSMEAVMITLTITPVIVTLALLEPTVRLKSMNGNGNCSDSINNYTCECSPGYTGVNCQTDIDECASSPCRDWNL